MINKNKIKKLLFKLTVWIFRKLRLKCIDENHTIGKVTYDSEGYAHAECEMCGEDVSLVGKTLGQVDKMSLKAVEKLLPKGETLNGLAKDVNKRSGLSDGLSQCPYNIAIRCKMDEICEDCEDHVAVGSPIESK